MHDFFWWAFFAVQLFFWILPIPPKKKQWSVPYQSDFLDVHPVSVVLLKFGKDSPGRALVQCDDVLHLVWTNVLSIFLDISRGKRMLRASFVRTIQRYANVHRSSVVTTGSLHSSPLSGLNACKGLKGNNSGECSQKIVSVAVLFWSYYHSTTATATYFMCFRFPFFFTSHLTCTMSMVSYFERKSSKDLLFSNRVLRQRCSWTQSTRVLI